MLNNKNMNTEQEINQIIELEEKNKKVVEVIKECLKNLEPRLDNKNNLSVYNSLKRILKIL